MEVQILEEIRRTNELLSILLYFVIARTVFWGMLLGTRIFGNRNKIVADTWRTIANDLYKKGKFEELLIESEEKLEKAPMDPNHLYWRAKALKGLKRESDLPDALSQLLDEVPDWKEDWMDKYVKKESSSEEDLTTN